VVVPHDVNAEALRGGDFPFEIVADHPGLGGRDAEGALDLGRAPLGLAPFLGNRSPSYGSPPNGASGRNRPTNSSAPRRVIGHRKAFARRMHRHIQLRRATELGGRYDVRPPHSIVRQR
jgi:hypothetical protein